MITAHDIMTHWALIRIYVDEKELDSILKCNALKLDSISLLS